MAAWVPVLAAITAAAAGLLGYRLTNRSKQLEAKAKAYADALTTIEAYKSLPYLIRRRAEDGNDQADLQHLVGLAGVRTRTQKHSHMALTITTRLSNMCAWLLCARTWDAGGACLRTG
jgi:hypothetical protein